MNLFFVDLLSAMLTKEYELSLQNTTNVRLFKSKLDIQIRSPVRKWHSELLPGKCRAAKSWSPLFVKLWFTATRKLSISIGASRPPPFWCWSSDSESQMTFLIDKLFPLGWTPSRALLSLGIELQLKVVDTEVFCWFKLKTRWIQRFLHYVLSFPT